MIRPGWEGITQMEEITLSVPSAFPDSGPSAPHSATKSPPGSSEIERLARGFLAAARSRDRFALTERRRRQRQESFERQLKRLIKTVASEAANAVSDRHGRADVRTRIYAAMMILARLAAHDQKRTARRARRLFNWSLATAAMGTAGTVFTLSARGWF
jgi:hypothetical protein